MTSITSPPSPWDVITTTARGAGLGAASGAAGGLITGGAIGLALAGRAPRAAWQVPLLMGAQFASMGAVVGAGAEHGAEHRPDRSASDRAARAAVAPAIAATAVIGGASIIMAIGMHRAGEATMREALMIAGLGLGTSLPAGALSGAAWGVLHG